MQIPLQRLLAQMEEELQVAIDTTSERQLRESVYAIKTLCELVLSNTSEQNIDIKQMKQLSTAFPSRTDHQITSQPITNKNKGHEVTESLLDF